MIDKLPMADSTQASAAEDLEHSPHQAFGSSKAPERIEAEELQDLAPWSIEKTKQTNCESELVKVTPAGLNPVNLNEQTTFNERPALPNPIFTTLKREKSLTDTLERKKKRVKFSCDQDGEGDQVTVKTHVFEEVNLIDALIRDSDIVSNTPLAKKLKRMLRNKSKFSENSVSAAEECGQNPSDECDRNTGSQDQPQDINSVVDHQAEEINGTLLNGESEITFIDEDSDSQSVDTELEKQNNKENSGGNTDDAKDDNISMKRGRTFTHEDNPPAKAQKISDETANRNDRNIKKKILIEEHEKYEPSIVLKSATENQLRLDEIVAQPQDKAKESPSPCSVIDKTVELKLNSSAAKRRAKVNIEKSTNPDKTCSDSEDEFKNEKAKCGSFRDSAKKTLINAWKSALKTSAIENVSKGANKDKFNAGENSSDNADISILIETENKDNGATSKNVKTSNKKGFLDTSGKVSSCSSHSKEATKSVKPKQVSQSGKDKEQKTEKQQGKLVGTVLPFRRDGTFTKKSRQQFDNERTRLESEIRKLSSENTRYVNF